MNTKLIVKKTTAPDNTYYIQPKYSVVAMTIGSTAATTYCTLQTIRVGFDTEANYNKWKSTKVYDAASGTTTLLGRDPVGIVGTLGQLSVDTLDHLIAYNLELLTPSSDS